MKFKIKKWDIVLMVILAVLLLTPVQSYITRYIFPNNTIEKNEDQALDQESLSLELKGYNTPNLTLSSTKGKVVFLHFWGTWCPDCNLEMPSVQKFYDLHKDKIQFVLVDIEKDNNYKKLTSYLEKHPYTVPIYEPISLMSRQLVVTSFPTTFIIDKDGNIVSKHEGATDWNLPEVQNSVLKLTE